MAVTAHFASMRADLSVIERSSRPIFDGGRQIGTEPGKSHQFENHRYKAEGQKSIDFLRSRIDAPDGPGSWS